MEHSAGSLDDATNGANLHILLLGSAQVLYHEQPLHIQRRLMRSLLFYLATQSHPVGRTQLMSLFWPEESETEARRHLRETLSKLRAQLPDPAILISKQDYIRLDSDKVYVDLWEFEDLIDQVNPYLVRKNDFPLPEATYQRMYKALSLWRQPIFLAGLNLPSTPDLDHMFTQASQSLEQSRLKLIKALARHAFTIGDLENAASWIQKALETDEDNLELYVWLIEILLQLGNYEAAAQVYDFAEGMFVDQEGELPEELEAFYSRVHEKVSPTAAEKPAPWHNLLTLQLPFVGRKDPLNQLKLALQRGGIEVIWGESGSGKSRLTFEFYQAFEPAPRLFFASGYFHTQDMPYQPIIEILRHSITNDEWLQVDDIWANILVELLPELPRIRPGTKIPDQTPAPKNSLQTIAEAIYQVYKANIHRQQLLIILDDAQWVDPVSFEIFAYILNHYPPANKGLLIINARLEEPSLALKNFLESSPATWNVHQIYLDNLNREEVAELSRCAFGKPLPTPLVEHLELDTGGNPLFLLESLRTWLAFELSPANYYKMEHAPVTSTIHSVMHERLRLLKPASQQALVIAAAAGNPFDTAVVAEASQLSGQQIITALDELEQVHLIESVTSSTGKMEYRFIHRKIRDVLLMELSPARQQYLYLQVALALQNHEDGSAEQAAKIARILEKAAEYTTAFRYWIKAGQIAIQHDSLPTANLYYKQAEGLFDVVHPPLSDELVHELYVPWGFAHLENGDLEQATSRFNALLHFGEQRYSPLLLGSAYNGLARVSGARQQPRIALLHMEQAIPFLRQSGTIAEQLEATYNQTIFLTQLLRYPEAIQILENFTLMRFESDDIHIRKVSAKILNKLIQLYLLTAQYGRGLKIYGRAVEISRTLLDPDLLANTLTLRAAIELHCRPLNEGLNSCFEALALAKKSHNFPLATYLYVQQAEFKLYSGRLDEAWRATEKASELANLYHLNDLLAYAYCIQGDILFYLRNFAGAAEIHRKALSVSKAHTASMESLSRLGKSLVLNGQTENGFSFLRQAIELTRETGLERVRLNAEFSWAYGKLSTGNLGEALVLAGQVTKELKNLGENFLSRWYEWFAALAARQLDPDTALMYSRQVIEHGQAVACPWLELRGIEIGLALSTSPSEIKAWKDEARLLFEGLQANCRDPQLRPALQGYLRSFSI